MWGDTPRRHRVRFRTVAVPGAVLLVGVTVLLASAVMLWTYLGPGSVPGTFTATSCPRGSAAGITEEDCYGVFRADDGRVLDRVAVYGGRVTIGTPLRLRREPSGSLTDTEESLPGIFGAAVGLTVTAVGGVRLARRLGWKPLRAVRLRW